MNGFRVVAIVLVIAAIVAFSTERLSRAQLTDDASTRPRYMRVEQRPFISIPLWAGVAAIIGGTLLMLHRRS